MSRSWARVPLWALATENREVIDPGSLGGKVLHYSIPALEATGHPEVAATEDIKSQKLRVRGGEVLVGRLNPRKSRVAVVGPFEGMPMVASTEFVPLAPDRIDRRFLMYAMLSERTRQYLDSCVRSATRSHQRVEPETITHLFVNVPDRGEQRRIAGFLDDQVARIDEIINLREEQAGAVQESVDHRIAEVVEEAASRWGWTTMRRIMRGIEQGWSPQCESRSAAAGEFGVLRLGAIRSGAFRELENKALPSGVEPAWSYQVMPGDLLISRANTPLLVGDVAVVPSTVPGNLFLPDLLYRVRLGIGEGEFVSAALRTPRVRGLVRVIARGTSQSMVKLRGEDIADLPIPAAPADVRAGIADQSVRGRSLALSMRKEMTAQIELLQERKRSMITAAVTGEFDVSTASGRGVA